MTPLQDLAAAGILYDANTAAIAQLEADWATARAEVLSVLADPASTQADIGAANEAERQVNERRAGLQTMRASIVARGWRAVVRAGVASFRSGPTTGIVPILPDAAGWLPPLPKGATWPPIGPNELLPDWD